MSDTQFQQQVLTALTALNSRFDTLEGKVDSLSTELHEFKESQEKFNERQEQFNEHMEQKTNALWALSNQSFSAISDIQKKSDDVHQEVIAPWKRRQTKSA